MENQSLNAAQTGIRAAKYSFLFGTLLFLARFIIKSELLMMIGLFYIIFAAIINALLFLALLLALVHPTESRAKILMAMLLMLLNIPICFVYMHFI